MAETALRFPFTRLPMTPGARASRSFPVARAINCSKARDLWRRQQRPIYNGQPRSQDFSLYKNSKKGKRGKKGWSHGVMVNTLDPESSDPSTNPT